METSHLNRFERHPVLTLVLAALALCLLLLVSDFVYSSLHPTDTFYTIFQAAPPIGQVFRPSHTFTYGRNILGEYKVTSRTNNLGLRDSRDLTPKMRAGKRLIFAMGDSTTAALEVALEQSWPKIMEQKMGDGTLVYNAGVSGYDTQQELILYLSRIRHLKPDAVILMICNNDFPGNMNPSLYPDFRTHFGKGVIDENGVVHYLPPTLSKRQNLLLSLRSVLATHLSVTNAALHAVLSLAVKRSQLQKEDEYPGFSEAAAMAKMKQLLSRFDYETKRDGVRLYITWSPGIAQEVGFSSNFFSSTQFKRYGDVKSFVEHKLHNSIFVPTLDHFADLYKRDPHRPNLIYLRDRHANAYGNNLIGNYMADFMRTAERGLGR